MQNVLCCFLQTNGRRVQIDHYRSRHVSAEGGLREKSVETVRLSPYLFVMFLLVDPSLFSSPPIDPFDGICPSG